MTSTSSPKVALFAIALAAFASPAGGQELAPDRAAAIDGFVQTFVDLGMFDGNVLIDVGGEVVYARSFGFANYEHMVATELNMRYRIASVSKTITDVAIAQLIEDGVLDLEARLSEFVPEFPRADEITIAMILDHASGIPHTNRYAWGDGTISMSLDELIERLAAEPFEFDPGQDRSYSNGGYAMLAKILEVARGKPFDEVLAEEFFRPLGMNDTNHLADSRLSIPNMATGYEPTTTLGARRHSRFYAVEVRPGGGSLYSSAPDLLTFLRAVCRGGLVSEENLVDVMGMEDGVLITGGRSPGFFTSGHCDRNTDMIVVSVSNNYAVTADWSTAIGRLASSEADDWPWPLSIPELSTEPPHEQFVGDFRGGYSYEHTRAPSGAVIRYQESQGSRYLMPALADGTLLEPMYWQICSRDDDGEGVTCNTLAGDERYNSRIRPVRSDALPEELQPD